MYLVDRDGLEFEIKRGMLSLNLQAKKQGYRFKYSQRIKWNGIVESILTLKENSLINDEEFASINKNFNKIIADSLIENCLFKL